MRDLGVTPIDLDPVKMSLAGEGSVRLLVVVNNYRDDSSHRGKSGGAPEKRKYWAAMTIRFRTVRDLLCHRFLGNIPYYCHIYTSYSNTPLTVHDILETNTLKTLRTGTEVHIKHSP